MDKIIDSLKKGMTTLVNETEKLGKVVADKTSNIVDVTKLNLSLNETERKITALYARIGEAVYADYQRGSETNGEITEICTEISSLKAEVDSIKAQLAMLKSSAVCPSCGEFNAKDSGYCSKCGTKLSEESENTEDMVIEVTEFPQE